jgi:hypothetical protein
MNVTLWAKVKIKVGNSPFAHLVYRAYTPIFQPAVVGGSAAALAADHTNKPGKMRNSYDGSAEIARKTGTTRLVSKLISGKTKCTAEMAQHQPELDHLISQLDLR